MISRRPGLRPVVLKNGTLDNPSIYGGAQKAIFTLSRNDKMTSPNSGDLP